MAKQPEPENFIDMFSNFGRDLRLPSMDIEKIISHHRKNLEALQKSASATVAGASNLMARQREALQDSLREITDMAQDFRAGGNPQDAMTRQVEFARKSFEAAVKNAGESADIVRKSGAESVEVLRARIKEAMDEVREAFEKKS